MNLRLCSSGVLRHKDTAASILVRMHFLVHYLEDTHSTLVVLHIYANVLVCEWIHAQVRVSQLLRIQDYNVTLRL